MGAAIAHSASVKSLRERRPLRSAARRCSGFHIGRSLANQAPTKESQPIHQTQQVLGSALSSQEVARLWWLHTEGEEGRRIFIEISDKVIRSFR
jgi:hypothetical protein